MIVVTIVMITIVRAVMMIRTKILAWYVLRVPRARWDPRGPEARQGHGANPDLPGLRVR